MAVKEIENSVASRIKQLRRDRNYSQTYIAKDLSITQAAYSQIENSTNGIIAEHIIKLSEMFDVTTDYILKGNSKLVEISYRTGFLPLIEVKAHAGFVKNYSKGKDYVNRDWYKIPGFNSTVDHKLFEVEGDSMLPTVLPGDILVCQIQQDIKNLNEKLILIITDKEVMVKRLERLGEDKIYVTNDNPDYYGQDEGIEFSKIQEVFEVLGKVRSFQVPGDDKNFRIKINDLEENIEILKSEIFTFKKELKALNIKK
ncbi:XRE family transcriptional regulator [Salinimicrobium sp. WS361]|uniref:XRE family transcriptional regulator n=1 Tax=Salinimicrobium sp. WS361 TaxID=3425123 RepID=UPI003D6E8305